MKRTNSAKFIGNEYRPNNNNFTSREILNEDKPLNFSIETGKINNSKINDTTPRKNSISKNTEKKMTNTDLNNLRFDAEPTENKKKLLKKSSTNNSIEMRNSFNINNNNNDIKSSINIMNNMSINNNNNNYQSSELEQFSPVKSANISAFKTPDKGN